MTALLRRSDPWSVQPGWGIVVDLTPPELLIARQLRLIRRLMVAAVVAVLALCAGGYVVALGDRSAAEDVLANAHSGTARLQQQASAYNGITEIQGAVTQVSTQIATLMKGDVSVDALLARIGRAEPAGLTLQTVSVVISPVGVAGAVAPADPSSIDDTGHARIGTVTMTGSARHLADVSSFVDRLSSIRGVLDVVPTSNSQDVGGGQFDVKFGLDDRLLTHRFDVKGGK